jgi:hypothetical protein
MTLINPGPAVSSSVNQAPGLSATWSDKNGTALVKPDSTLATINPVSTAIGASAGLVIAVVGDSLSAGSNALQTPVIGNFSASGSIGSIVTGSILYVTAGNQIFIRGIDQPEWNGVKTVLTNDGTTITFTNSTPLSKSPTATASATSSGTPFVMDLTVVTNRAFISIANGLLGLPFGAIHNRAVSGTTTTHMLNNFDTDIAPLVPTDIWLLGGINDLSGAASTLGAQNIAVAAAFANLIAIVAKAQALGARVWWSTLPPYTAAGGTGTDANATAIRQAALLRLNGLIRCYIQANQSPLLKLVDTHRRASNKTGNNWAAGSSIWSVDGLHWTSYGAFNSAALEFNSVASGILNRPWPLVENALDSYASDTSSLQLFPDPLMQATLTSAITGFTGAGGAGNPVYVTDFVPSRAAGTPTASIDVVARTDGIGNDQRCTIAATAAADQIDFGMANTAHITTQLQLYVGRTVKLALGFKMASVPAGTFSGVDVYLRNSGFTTFFWATSQNTPNFNDINAEWIIESAPFVVPTGWSTISSHVVLRFAGNAANAVFTFGRPQLMVIN